MLRAVVAAAAGLALPVGTGIAQSVWTPRLQLDNDVYNFWRRHTHRPDEEYTNGVRATLESFSAPVWGARLAPRIADCADVSDGVSPCRATAVTLGQDLYTPNLHRAPYQVPDWESERPYFAWLYLSGSARISSPRTLRTVDLSLGVTGPPALGELAQSAAHGIGFNQPATGWETQIGFEPGLILEYRQRSLFARGRDHGPGLELAPEFAVAAGNIRTATGVGGVVRTGWNLSHPWYPGAWRHRADMEWWLAAGGRLEYVARDMSLDGTWRHPARRVERVPGVRQYEFGAGVRLRTFALEYRAVTRSREYVTGPEHHTYSSMIASLSVPR